ncbi:hypothetical protein [Martelella limonii]|uniref:hypothetical protein n=1 Tax=Martelella limonii TaxID=1647649 RepID=UPI00157FEEFF|nr:hypothetical protein [Martelella limonii]
MISIGWEAEPALEGGEITMFSGGNQNMARHRWQAIFSININYITLKSGWFSRLFPCASIV